MESGDDFPPLILENEGNRLLDGKHRHEAYKLAGIDEAEVDEHLAQAALVASTGLTSKGPGQLVQIDHLELDGQPANQGYALLVAHGVRGIGRAPASA